MERGDIGDARMSRVPRVVLIWEGVCAAPPEKDVQTMKDRFDRWTNKEVNWARIVRSWQIFEQPLQRIEAMAYRGIPVDIVTFLGEDYCDALRDRLDLMHVEPARVDWYEDAAAFARDLRTSRAIEYVVDSDPERLKLYGKRGMATTLGEDWGKFI